MPSCSVTKWSTILYILIRITTNATHKVRSVTEQEWIQFSIFVISFQLSKIHFFMTKLRQFFMKFSCLWYCLDSYPRIGTKPRNETIVLACIAKGTESRRRSLGWNICNMQKEHACSLARTAMAEPRTIFLCRLNMHFGLYRSGQTKGKNFREMKLASWFVCPNWRQEFGVDTTSILWFVPRWPNQRRNFEVD